MITKKLQDITLNITDGKHGDCENENNSGFYFISCKDVHDGTIHYDGARQITEKDFIEAHRRTMLILWYSLQKRCVERWKEHQPSLSLQTVMNLIRRLVILSRIVDYSEKI